MIQTITCLLCGEDFVTITTRKICLRCCRINKVALEEVRSILDDKDLMDTIGRDCHDPYHERRWCSTCEARLNGIDAYRNAILQLLNEDSP